jgi:hypothetical protein
MFLFNSRVTNSIELQLAEANLPSIRHPNDKEESHKEIFTFSMEHRVGRRGPRGFVREAVGIITAFDAPGATGTFPLGINSSGVITGLPQSAF